MVAMHLGHLGRFVTGCSFSKRANRSLYEFEASNKIFHSVMARVPVAMSDHIEKRLLNERHGIGVLFDETDPGDIARTVEAFLEDRAAYDAAVEACTRAAELLNWEHEERTLLSMFERVLEPAAARP